MSNLKCPKMLLNAPPSFETFWKLELFKFFKTSNITAFKLNSDGTLQSYRCSNSSMSIYPCRFEYWYLQYLLCISILIFSKQILGATCFFNTFYRLKVYSLCHTTCRSTTFSLVSCATIPHIRFYSQSISLVPLLQYHI